MIGKKIKPDYLLNEMKIKKTLTAHTVLKNKDSFLEYLFVESMKI